MKMDILVTSYKKKSIKIHILTGIKINKDNKYVTSQKYQQNQQNHVQRWGPHP
jgi:hypothetical protein